MKNNSKLSKKKFKKHKRCLFFKSKMKNNFFLQIPRKKYGSISKNLKKSL